MNVWIQASINETTRIRPKHFGEEDNLLFYNWPSYTHFQVSKTQLILPCSIGWLQLRSAQTSTATVQRASVAQAIVDFVFTCYETRLSWNWMHILVRGDAFNLVWALQSLCVPSQTEKLPNPYSPQGLKPSMIKVIKFEVSGLGLLLFQEWRHFHDPMTCVTYCLASWQMK